MFVSVMSFITTLTARLDKADIVLPLSAKDEQTLKNLLGADGAYTYLVLRDDINTEVIKVESTCDSLIVTRGQDDTVAKSFPRGTCIKYELVTIIVKDLICTYNCCEDATCPCTPVKAEGISLSPASVGVPWSGAAVFSGDVPMVVAASGAPSWVQAIVGTNNIAFSGTPTVAGTFTISAAATNCDGQIAIQQGVLTVS